MSDRKPGLGDAEPRVVLFYFGSLAALALAAAAFPFVPEAILALAVIQYLRHFSYRWRLWRAPARVPAHLGARGYRDTTTRTRGDANWPLGLAATGQVWLRREDLVQGVAFASDDPAWQGEVAAVLMFGACLNRTGALILQAPNAPPIANQLRRVVTPFGRDAELLEIDFAASARPVLRLAPSTLEMTARSLGLEAEAEPLFRAMLPLVVLSREYGHKNPLTLFRALRTPESLAELAAGQHFLLEEIAGRDCTTAPAGDAVNRALAQLQRIGPSDLEAGRRALMALADELASQTQFSLTDGLDLATVLRAQALVCIRPSSPLSAALVLTLCTEALNGDAAESRGLVHVAWPRIGTSDLLTHFREVALKAGAIGTLALPSVLPPSFDDAIEKCCAVRGTYRLLRQHTRIGKNRHPLPPARIVSSLKGCDFALDVKLLETDAVK